MTVATCYLPTRPYLLFHPRFVCTYANERWQYQMWQGEYALEWFKVPCFAIDVECRKFPLVDVVSHGLACTIWNIFPGRGSNGRRLDVEYVFGPPTQMTFEEVRELYVEWIVKMRRTGQNGETQAQFRARNAQYGDPKEFIDSVGLMGTWPSVKESKRKNK